MYANRLRFLLILIFGGSFIGLFSSCSNVAFEEKPIAACNSSGLTCQQAIENGRKVNTYDYDYSQKADILFVVDNSKSMAPEQALLGHAFSDFATALPGIDWQVAITTTDMSGSGWGGQLADIATSYGTVKILNSQTPGYENSFYAAISGQGESGSNDERGILSALKVVESGKQSGFLRANSHLAVIVLSDEDERSTGGVTQGLELSAEENPRNYINTVNALLSGGAHSFYSIIIRPGDSQCFNAQKSQTFQGYYGERYFEIQKLISKEIYGKEIGPTSPEVGNICDSSYYGLMKNIAEEIKTKVETLPCDPIDGIVNLTPSFNYYLKGRQLIISPTPTQAFHVNYKCYAN